MARLVAITFALTVLVVWPVYAEEPEESWKAGLASEEKSERLRAMETLAERGGEAAAVPALLEQLEHDDLDVRAAAARTLGAIGADGPTVIPVLIEHFSDQGEIMFFEPKFDIIPVWVVYAQSVAKFGGEAIGPLAESLDDDSPQICVAAAVGLEAIGPEAARVTPQLIEMLDGSDEGRQRAAAGVIRGIGPGAAAAVPAIRKHLDAENFHTQYWMCRALGAIGPESAVATDELVALVAGGNPSVRRNAAAALGQIGPEVGAEAVDGLIHAMENDFMAPVREQAVIALGQLKPYAEKSVPAIRRCLADPSFHAPTHAARSLWLLTDDVAEPIAELTRQMDDLTHFQHAVEVLGEMGPAATPAVDRLIEALSERDPDDRVSAAIALGRIGPPAARAGDALRALLEDEKKSVGAAAAVALEVFEAMKP